MNYFVRDSLPEPMDDGVRIRIIDSLDGVTGIVRVIPQALNSSIAGAARTPTATD